MIKGMFKARFFNFVTFGKGKKLIGTRILYVMLL